MSTVEQFEDMKTEGMVVARTPRQLAFARLRRDYVALASLVFIILLVLFALAGPLFESWTGHPVNTSNSTGVDDYTLLPVGPMHGCANGLASVGERACFVLGASNNLGYDMLVQLSFGARTSLIIGIVATFLTMVVALLLGVIAGNVGGWTDTVIARVLGASNSRIIFRHLMPQLIGPLTVYASLSVAGAIAAEAALSYLGFGLPLEIPSWGRMISDAVPGGLYINAPFLMVFPGTLLVVTVLAFNLLGDGLRDALDPRGGTIL